MNNRVGWLRGPLLMLLIATPVWAEDDIKEMESQFNKAQEKFYEQARKGDVDWEKHPAREFLPKFKAWAKENAGEAEAVPALVWIVRNGQSAGERGEDSATAWAVKQLGKSHTADPAIKDALPQMMYLGWQVGEEPLINFYEKVLKNNKDDEALATANFNLGFTLYGRSRPDGAGPLGGLSGGGKKKKKNADRERALALFNKVTQEYKDSKVAERAAGFIYEMENLQIGMKAPEIIGKDVKGNEVKLSDFKGRVVVIDFWGFW